MHIQREKLHSSAQIQKGKLYLVFLFVLMVWSLLPNALRPFQIYFDPTNLGIRT